MTDAEVDAFLAEIIEADDDRTERIRQLFEKKLRERQRPTCPRCGSRDVIVIHRPEVYEFGYVCIACERGFD